MESKPPRLRMHASNATTLQGTTNYRPNLVSDDEAADAVRFTAADCTQSYSRCRCCSEQCRATADSEVYRVFLGLVWADACFQCRSRESGYPSLRGAASPSRFWIEIGTNLSLPLPGPAGELAPLVRIIPARPRRISLTISCNSWKRVKYSAVPSCSTWSANSVLRFSQTHGSATDLRSPLSRTNRVPISFRRNCFRCHYERWCFQDASGTRTASLWPNPSVPVSRFPRRHQRRSPTQSRSVCPCSFSPIAGRRRATGLYPESTDGHGLRE